MSPLRVVLANSRIEAERLAYHLGWRNDGRTLLLLSWAGDLDRHMAGRVFPPGTLFDSSETERVLRHLYPGAFIRGENR